MRTLSIEVIATQATNAALSVIDKSLDGTTKKSAGECGDKLAATLFAAIKKAIVAHAESDQAPALIKLI